MKLVACSCYVLSCAIHSAYIWQPVRVDHCLTLSIFMHFSSVKIFARLPAPWLENHISYFDTRHLFFVNNFPVYFPTSYDHPHRYFFPFTVILSFWFSLCSPSTTDLRFRSRLKSTFYRTFYHSHRDCLSDFLCWSTYCPFSLIMFDSANEFSSAR